LTAIAVVTTGRAVLWPAYKGHPPTLHRSTVDELERRDRAVRNELVAIIDKCPDPADAVAALRAWAELDENRDARHRVDRLAPVRLPTENVPRPVRST
jgi:hypothetical protein